MTDEDKELTARLLRAIERKEKLCDVLDEALAKYSAAALRVVRAAGVDVSNNPQDWRRIPVNWGPRTKRDKAVQRDDQVAKLAALILLDCSNLAAEWEANGPTASALRMLMTLADRVPILELSEEVPANITYMKRGELFQWMSVSTWAKELAATKRVGERNRTSQRKRTSMLDLARELLDLGTPASRLASEVHERIGGQPSVRTVRAVLQAEGLIAPARASRAPRAS